MSQVLIPPMPAAAPPAGQGVTPPAPKKKAGRKGLKIVAIVVGALVAVGIVAAIASPKTAAPVAAAAPSVVAPSFVPPALTPPTEAPAPDFTVSQQQAIESAQSYLDMGGFSKTGLIGQLSSKYGEGFPKADALFAVNHIKVNWNEQAVESAKSYMDMGGFSCQGLISQLESSYGDGFTHSQAVYGANQTGVCG